MRKLAAQSFRGFIFHDSAVHMCSNARSMARYCSFNYANAD